MKGRPEDPERTRMIEQEKRQTGIGASIAHLSSILTEVRLFGESLVTMVRGDVRVVVAPITYEQLILWKDIDHSGLGSCFRAPCDHPTLCGMPLETNPSLAPGVIHLRAPGATLILDDRVPAWR